MKIMEIANIGGSIVKMAFENDTDAVEQLNLVQEAINKYVPYGNSGTNSHTIKCPIGDAVININHTVAVRLLDVMEWTRVTSDWEDQHTAIEIKKVIAQRQAIKDAGLDGVK